MSNYLITANNIAELGGAQHVAHSLARGLVSRGHSVHLVGSTPVADAHTYADAGYQTVTLMPEIWPAKNSTNGAVRAGLREQAVTDLRSLLQSLGSANIVATQLWSLEVVLDAIAGYERRFPVVGQYHGSFAAAASGRDLRRAQKLAGRCEYFTVLSKEDAAAFAQAGLTNVVALGNPNTVSLAQFAEATAQVRTASVDFVGRLSAEKGPDLLLAAWEQVQPAGLTLRLTGTGPLRAELAARGMPHVEFADPVEHAAGVIGRSRLVVLPSRTEGAPLVLAEALTLGTPVVVIDVSSGVREMVVDNPLAVLVERDNVTALADGIVAGLAIAPHPNPSFPDDSNIFDAFEELFAISIPRLK
ncbi:MAG: glycosyltransferase [Actinomycetota bacterium]|nr:glycosyltransferase [Actinomycetota bacterium]